MTNAEVSLKRRRRRRRMVNEKNEVSCGEKQQRNRKRKR